MQKSLIASIIASLLLVQSFPSAAGEGTGQVNLTDVTLGEGANQVSFQTAVFQPSAEELDEVLDSLPSKEPIAIATTAVEEPQAEEIKEKLIKNGVSPDTIKIEVVADQFGTDTAAAAGVARYRDHIVPHTRGDVIIGRVQVAYRLAAASYATIISVGMHPVRGLAFIALACSLTALFAIKWKTLDNFFSHSVFNPARKVSPFFERRQREGWDYISSQIQRLVSGPISNAKGVITAHRFKSWDGQLELLQNLAFFTLVGSRFASIRNATFRSDERQYANKWVAFDVFMAGAFLSTLNQMGVTWGTWASMTIHHVKLSLTTVDALNIFVYLAATALIKYKTDFVLKFTRKQEDKFNQFLERKAKCNLELSLLPTGPSEE